MAASFSCKAAVKAGDRLNDHELAELIAGREEIERISNCPHGRPTSLRISIAELDRKFVNDPSDVVSVGDIVRVKVLSVELERKRIALSRKQLL